MQSTDSNNAHGSSCFAYGGPGVGSTAQSQTLLELIYVNPGRVPENRTLLLLSRLYKKCIIILTIGST